jgi:hypothetical protein
MAKIMEAMVVFARDTIAKTFRKSRKRKEALVEAITGQLDSVLHHLLAMWGASPGRKRQIKKRKCHKRLG